MADIDPNFTCLDPSLSHSNITSEVWKIRSEGQLHENSITAAAICQILIIAVGLPWNAIVLASIIITHHYKEPTYILLMNLVIADLSVCLFVLPFNVAFGFAKELTIGTSDYVRCQVCFTIAIIIISFVYISLFTLALMSIDRLIYVRWPLKYDNIVKVPLIIFLLAVVWIFCIMLSILPIFGFGEIKYANSLSSCSLLSRGETQHAANIKYTVVLAIVGILVFTTTAIVNIWLFVVACKTVRERHNKQASSNSSRFDSTLQRREAAKELSHKLHRQQILLAQVFGALFTANLVTWLPSVFIAFVGAAIGVDNIPPPAIVFLYLAHVSQPAIHPVLETCLIGKAKKMLFNNLFCCKIVSKKKAVGL